MTKLSIILLALLAGSTVLNVQFSRVDREYTDNVNGFALVNSALASRLLADGLKNRQIVLYAEGDAPSQSFVLGDYTVRVVCLGTDFVRPGWGWCSFFGHNSSCVFAFACHEFGDKPEFALNLFRLVAKLGHSRDAIWVVSQIGADGKLTGEAREKVRAWAEDFDEESLRLHQRAEAASEG